jgi:endonuclease-8
MRAVGKKHAFDLNGPTACDLLTTAQRDSILRRLGADPLRKDADVENAWQRISRSRSPLGTLLLNQSVIAGVGNVYRAEVLFKNGLHPERPGKSLTREQFDQLWSSLVQLLRVGMKYNRIITTEPESIGKPASRLNRSERLLCYQKTHCPRCSSTIARWELGARTIYACENCQS